MGSTNEDENDENGLGVEEEACKDLSEHFGDIARNNLDESDGDSGDDIWNDDIIPDPLSSDDDEEGEHRDFHGNIADHDELLSLGKTFGCASDFKLALLRYSLKTGYDIKLCKSTSMKLGAMCSDKECSWRVYCSYEKSRHKMQIKVYINEHVCIRSGYSKLLKISSIAQLFEERLKVNPKLTKKDCWPIFGQAGKMDKEH